MNVKEFVIFVIAVALGGIVGGWLNTLLGIEPSDLMGQLLTFLVPTTIIYVIWKKVGEPAAER